MFNEIKSFLGNDAIFYSLLIVGVAVTSFGLGRLSVETETTSIQRISGAVVANEVFVTPKTPIVSNQPESGEPAVAGTSSVIVIASKNGTKYHFPWCPGAKQIKESNLITFDSPLLARASGYTPATNCPGLE